MSTKEAGKHLLVSAVVLLLTCSALVAQDNWNGKLGEDRGPTAGAVFGKFNVCQRENDVRHRGRLEFQQEFRI